MGGKKKKSTGGVVKRDSKYKIPRSFDCPVCDAKAAIQIKPNHERTKAFVHCRVCGQPNPPYEAKFGKLIKNHDAFFEFYEWLRKKDAEQLERHQIVVHPTDAVYVQSALEGVERKTDAGVSEGEEGDDDDEIAGLLNTE
jgi:transcription elongation factor Elf1